MCIFDRLCSNEAACVCAFTNWRVMKLTVCMFDVLAINEADRLRFTDWRVLKLTGCMFGRLVSDEVDWMYVSQAG